PIGNPAENLNIGRKEQNGNYFDGYIDEARVASTNRSAEWIETEYNNQNSPSTFYPNYASESQVAGSFATLDSNGQTINAGGSWTNSGTYTHNNSQVTFDGSSAFNITSGGSSFYLTIFDNASGSWTLQDALTTTNDVQINATDNGSGGVDFNGNTVTVGDDLRVSQATSYLTLGSSTVNIADEFTISNGGIDAGTSTIVFDGNQDQALVTNGQTFNNITLNNTGTSGLDDLVISGNLDIDGNLTITDGDLDLGASNPTVNLAGNLSIGANGSVTKSSGAWTFDGSGTNTWADSSAGQDIGTVTINGTSKTVSTSSNVNATSLTIGADDTLDLTDDTLTLSDNWTNNGNFTSTSSTVVFSGTSAGKTITANGASGLFNNISFTGSGGAWTLQDSMTVTGKFEVTNGSFVSGANTVTIQGANATYQAADVAAANTDWTGGTLNIQSDTDQTLPASETYNNLQFGRDAGTGTTVYDILDSSSTINGTWTIDADAKVLLTVDATGVNREYDATTDATVTLSDNHMASWHDNFTTNYSSATFGDKNVGVGKTVNVTGISLSGVDASKYQLSSTTDTTTAVITAKSLTVSGITADNKVYDDAVAATLNTGSAAFVGVIGGDTVTIDVASATGEFSDQHVGTGKTVQVAGVDKSGTDSGNYSITQPTTT
ncbi:MAG: YDG domain-containing protein, partial [Candidatus Omnitrophota bacterium]